MKLRQRTWSILAGMMIGQIVAAQPPVSPPDTMYATPGVRVVAPTPGQRLVYMSPGAPIMPFGGPVDVVSAAGHVGSGVVTGKPYTARATTVSTQLLADGNRITHRNEARIYRDSQGRTRREQSLSVFGSFQPAVEPLTMITIEDPAAGITYFLDPQARTARALRPFQLAPGPGGANAELTPLPLPLPMPMPMPMDRGTAVAAADAPATDVTLAAPRPFTGLREAPVQALLAGAASAYEPANSLHEDLGEQILEGVLARGTRDTHTIPAGTIGNERPIEIVTEQWVSTDLDAVVLRRHSDPRFGETVYQLAEVDRSEPAPELFAVPADYRLESDAEQSFMLRRFSSSAAGGETRTFERQVILVQPDAAVAPE